MAEGVITVDSSTFDELIQSSTKPVVVDFWAEWCGPCKAIAPLLSEVAKERADDITVAKLNVDDNPDLAMRYNVMSIPTLLVFNGGEVQKRIVGAKPKSALLNELAEFIGVDPLTSGFPTYNAHGDAVRDVQRRLRVAGFPVDAEEFGTFQSSTAEAVKQFQRSRGLHADGACNEQTWAALVESGRVLGERPLFLTAPHLRGDDVADLQRRVARLGFDCGKVDGIFGPMTSRALVEFQHNSGLITDGIFGLATLRILDRLSGQTGAGPGISMLRQHEAARTADVRALCDARVVIGQYGAMGAVVKPIAQQLRASGCLVVPIDDPDPFLQSSTANAFEADVYLGLEVAAQYPKVSFYSVPAFESVGGRALAFRCITALEARGLFPGVHLVGERLTALRETRMPAVICALGPVRSVLDHAHLVAAALTDALAGWLGGVEITPAGPSPAR